MSKPTRMPVGLVDARSTIVASATPSLVMSSVAKALSCIGAEDRLDRAAAQIVFGPILERPAVHGQNLGYDLDRSVDRGVVMGGADHERRGENATPNRLLEEQGPEQLRSIAIRVKGRVD